MIIEDGYNHRHAFFCLFLFFIYLNNKQHYDSGINMRTTVIGHLNSFILHIVHAFMSGLCVCVLCGGEQLLTRCARADDQHSLTSQFISR